MFGLFMRKLPDAKVAVADFIRGDNARLRCENKRLTVENEQKDGALRYNRDKNISLLKQLRELRLILEETQLEREAALKSNEDLVCENSKLKALNAGFSDTLEKLSVWYDKVRAERDSLLKRIEFREEE